MKPPYLIHTNRELGLMLKGLKPLAVFSDCEDRFPAAVLRYLRLFDRRVAEGKLVREEDTLPPGDHGDFRLKRIYYALPGEEWRIDAMRDLKNSPRWTLKHERREGELLGYSDDQNDWFIAWLESGKT